MLGAEAGRFLDDLNEHPVAHDVPAIEPLGLSDDGLGVEGALAAWAERYAPWMSGSASPRYFGFVTDGATPGASVRRGIRR